jgi:hypothetical protein
VDLLKILNWSVTHRLGKRLIISASIQQLSGVGDWKAARRINAGIAWFCIESVKLNAGLEPGGRHEKRKTRRG